MNLNEIRAHMQERDFAANGVFQGQLADETRAQAKERVLHQLADDVPDLMAENAKLSAEVGGLKNLREKLLKDWSEAAARAAAAELRVCDLHKWARERGREHHGIAVEKRDDDELLTQHNALSSAYFRLADEIERRSTEKPKDVVLVPVTHGPGGTCNLHPCQTCADKRIEGSPIPNSGQHSMVGLCWCQMFHDR